MAAIVVGLMYKTMKFLKKLAKKCWAINKITHVSWALLILTNIDYHPLLCNYMQMRIYV